MRTPIDANVHLLGESDKRISPFTPPEEGIISCHTTIGQYVTR